MKKCHFLKKISIGYISFNDFLNYTDMYRKLCKSLDR